MPWHHHSSSRSISPDSRGIMKPRWWGAEQINSFSYNSSILSIFFSLPSLSPLIICWAFDWNVFGYPDHTHKLFKKQASHELELAIWFAEPFFWGWDGVMLTMPWTMLLAFNNLFWGGPSFLSIETLYAIYLQYQFLYCSIKIWEEKVRSLLGFKPW